MIIYPLQDGAPKIAFKCQISGFMVDITIVNGDIMVYKPTNISGGPNPVMIIYNLGLCCLLHPVNLGLSVFKSVCFGDQWYFPRYPTEYPL